MLRNTRRIGFVLCAILLASCAQSTQTADDGIVVTGNRTVRQDQEAVVAPLSPPPPPVMAMEAGRARGVAPYAQMAPQPMPGDVDRDQYEDVDTNPIHLVAEEPVSTFSIDVDTASYSNVRRFLSEGRLPPSDAVRTEELINYFDYAYPLPQTRAQPFSTNVTVAPSPWAEGRQLVHIGLQGYDIVPRERPPLNLVLLLDVSGSMNAPNKLPLLQQSFRLLIDQLNERDRVAIVVYAGAAGTVLEPTPGNQRGRILAALDSLTPGGSTAGAEGLRQAYALAEQNFDRNAVNRVIIGTDGDFNVGIADPEQLQDFVSRKRETGIYLSVFGFGGGNYNDALMQRLAQNGNGVATYIDTLNEARRVLRDEMASNMFTIANDVKIQVEFNPARVAEYRLIGYETRMLRREDFNNDQIDAGEIGSGHSVTAIYEITPVGGPTFTEPLRYQEGARQAPSTASELAFLRIRYKLPGEDDSRLIERPITNADIVPDIMRASESTRWAAAVAGYGQLLRGDAYLRQGYGYDDVISLAQSARGNDEFGWRAEFIQLARNAQTAAALPTQTAGGAPDPQPRTTR
ncbi:MAG TPA: VWA domain-containing protein [Vitreimonas sp.]|uniref:vWA domain-containing protein n=1 Tax=Vitreimonas sp. TaxID=3069702 RepID=UPI002D55847F|nr:VWA domain-containing protein [Vitreimonas sp.]HYD86507.1 VWA domain-containing protein [Vitreimonas sp.]